MPEKLTINEKTFVGKFLEKYGLLEHDSSFKYYFISILITLLGLFILVYSVILTVNNMVDRVVHWVLIPGVIFGLILMLVGFYLWQYYKQKEEKIKLAVILKKLLPETGSADIKTEQGE